MTKKANNPAVSADILFEKVVLYMDRFLLGIGGIAVILIMILATVNVAFRLFAHPLGGGAYEVIAYLGAVSIASALGYTQRRKDHIIVDILSDKYGKIVRRIVDTISSFIMALFFLFVSKGLFVWGMTLYNKGEVSETLKIAYHPFVLFVAAGFIMLSITCLAETIRTAFNITSRETE